MYLFEASISLGTSMTTMRRVQVVNIVLSYPDLSFRTEAHNLSQLLEMLMADHLSEVVLGYRKLCPKVISLP